MMSKSEFTSGPWEVETEMMKEEGFTQYTKGQEIVTNIDGQTYVIARINWSNPVKANARLIAAAPDMYEACKSMIDALGGLHGGLPDSTFTEPYFAMREAIAKAGGWDETPCLTKR